MMLLLPGILLFAVPHFLSILLPSRRDELKQRLGANAWRAGYSLATLLGLVLMGWAIARARSGDAATDWIYVTPEWMWPVTKVLVAAGFISLVAAALPGHLRQWLQNPMSIGVSLWAVGHLIAIGKRVDVYVFVTILAVALADIAVSMARGKKPKGPASLVWDGAAVAGGLVLYAIFLYGFHPYVLNLPVAN